MKYEMRQTRVLAVLLALIVAVTFSFTLGAEDVSAASKKPAKVNYKTIKAKTATHRSITLTWKKAKHATKYKVAYRVDKKGTSWKYKTVKSKKSKVTFKIAPLAMNTKYKIKIKGYNKKGKAGKYSKTITLKTKKPSKKLMPMNDPEKKTTPKNPSNPSSSQKPATTTPTSSPSTGTSTANLLRYKEDKNVKLTYGNATIHLGQDWTATLRNQLTAGASGTESIVRKGFIERTITDSNFNVLAEKTFDETVYMIDTGDYDNFLTLYIVNNQIVEWVTTRSDMGTSYGVSMHRGDKTCPTKGYLTFLNHYQYIKSVPEKGVLFGGFRCEELLSGSSWIVDVEKEKRVGFHYINAYRKLNDARILKYNKYLDGGKMTWSGHIEVLNIDVTNHRFGAQPWAETMAANNWCAHPTTANSKKMPYGPLGNGIGGRVENIAKESSKGTSQEVGFYSLIKDDVATGMTGEGCLLAYPNTHLVDHLNPTVQWVGIGMCDGYHCELFAQ